VPISLDDSAPIFFRNWRRHSRYTRSLTQIAVLQPCLMAA
jgi:hypothetical protein